MSGSPYTHLRFSDRDLDFLVEVAAPDVRNKSQLKKIIREDNEFCRSFIGDDNVFRRVMDDDEIVVKISPALFFEILLRHAAKELSKVSYTLEKNRAMSIPVFDSQDLVELLNEPSMVVYLADMLSSFTRVESYTFTFRIRKGVWKKIRFNDMDITSLIQFSEVLEDDHRMGLYKRIADICLFVLGVFPDFAERDYRYALSGEVRPQIAGRSRINPEEDERKGQQFYRLAAEHRAAAQSDLSEIFWSLHDNFEKARKPLNFIADYYLKTKRHTLFA